MSTFTKDPLPPIKLSENTITSTISLQHSYEEIPDYMRITSHYDDENFYTKIRKSSVIQLKKYCENRNKGERDYVTKFPIFEKFPRASRYIYNCSVDLRNLLDSYKTRPSFVIKSISASDTFGSTPQKRSVISKADYLTRQVNRCYTIKKLDSQMQQADKMYKLLEKEESWLTLINYKLDKERIFHHSVLSKDFKQTHGLLSNYDHDRKTRFARGNILKKLIYQIGRLNSECIHLEEYLKILVHYKTFLNKSSPDDITHNIENQTKKLMSNRIDLLKKAENKMKKENKKNKKKDDDSENSEGSSALSNQKKRRASMGMPLQKKCYTPDINKRSSSKSRKLCPLRPHSFDKKLSSFGSGRNHSDLQILSNQLESFISSCSDNYIFSQDDIYNDQELLNQLNTPTDLPFDSPEEFNNTLFDLEFTNLSLIENLHEEDKINDRWNNIRKKEFTKHNKEKEEIQKCLDQEKSYHVKHLNQLEILNISDKCLDSYGRLDSYKHIFSFSGLGQVATIQDVIKKIFPIVERIFCQFSNKSHKMILSLSDLISMLTAIEKRCDELFIKIKDTPYDTYKTARQAMVLQKRSDMRIRLKEQTALNKAAIRDKVLQKAKQRPLNLPRRRLITRSKPPSRHLDTKIKYKKPSVIFDLIGDLNDF